MPIYEESKHHWQSWFILDKKEGPLWPAGLTKADWDKKKALLARGKKTGITEVLQAAQKAFVKAVAERKELPASPGAEREESQKKAETYWKGTSMDALRDAMKAIIEKADAIDDAYVGSLAPEAAIKKTKAAAKEILVAARGLSATLREDNFAKIWQVYVHGLDETSGKNSSDKATVDLRGLKDKLRAVTELIHGEGITNALQIAQRELPEETEGENGKKARQEAESRRTLACKAVHTGVIVKRSELNIELQKVRAHVKSGNVTVLDPSVKANNNKAKDFELKAQLWAGRSQPGLTPTLTPTLVAKELQDFKTQLEEITPLVNQAATK